MSTFDLSKRIKVANPHANISEFYGTYNGETLEAAKTAACTATANIRQKGLTVGLTVNNGEVQEFWFKDGTADSDLVPKHNYYTLPTANISELGGVKIGANMEISANGEITAKTGTSANTVCSGNDSRLTNSRQPLAHTHQNSDLTGIANWAKATTKPTYNADEISDNSTNKKFVTSDEKLAWNSKLGQEALNSYAQNNSPQLTGTPTAPTAPSGTSTTQIATTDFVCNEILAKLAANDAMIFKGTIGTDGATIDTLPATHNAGWTYRVITAGTYAGKNCEIGDLIICTIDGTTATNGHWTVAQTNIDGAVMGPTSSTHNHVATFDGTSGKTLKDSGFTINASVPSGAKFTDTTYSNMSGATSTVNGTSGLVPAPAKGKQNHFLRGDGTWVVPTDTKYTLPDFGVTATATELNKLDGATATTAEINKLHGLVATTAELNTLRGVTATATEINTLDGITASTDELNKLDGATATTAEINHLSGVTSAIQTQINAKAPTNHASTATTYGQATATKYGHAMASSATPLVAGTASVGTDNGKFAREAHIHPAQTSVTGNAGTATKLATPRTIDGVSFDGTEVVKHYTACTTEGNVAEKAVNLQGFNLAHGARIVIRFTNANTASNVTLNVNGLGAKAVYCKGARMGYFPISTREFVYDGGIFDMIGEINTTYSPATTTTNGLLTSADKVKLNGIEANATSNQAGEGLINTEGVLSVDFENTVATKAHTHLYAGSSSVGGSATSATKLATARKINGISFDGSANICDYGFCNTASSVADKTTDIEGFSLVNFATVRVYFNTTNTASNPTLNISETGAKPIYYLSQPLPPYLLKAGGIYIFSYSTTRQQFLLVGEIYTHPTEGANTGSFGNSSNATPSFGSTFNVPYITVNANGHTSAIANKTVKIPDTKATSTAFGIVKVGAGLSASSGVISVDHSAKIARATGVKVTASATAPTSPQQGDIWIVTE